MVRRVVLSLLFAILLIMGVGVTVTIVHGQAVFVTVPLPSLSARNQIIDFYAGGSSGDYSLRASPQGASLSINGLGEITLTPWGYVTAQWSLGRVYIIFLANVTQTDFRIGFLYLTNVTDEAFILRWFDYDNGGSLSMWTFQGVQHVYNATVTVTPVEMPKLQIPTTPTVTNAISALGPDLYLTAKGGQWYNDSTRLSIYPLLNQLYGGSSDYNEVWSLLADGAGRYYFAILYMQNSDPDHVIIEHQLRLNDYRRLDGRTIQARWVKGLFSNDVTVRTGWPNLTVMIDGFPFQTNERGLVSESVPVGRVSIQVPAVIQSGASKLSFTSWSRFGTADPLNLVLNSTLDIYANYTQEYQLTVTTPFGTATGSGWYPQGANATFGVESQIDRGDGTRIVFEKWRGDSNSTSNQTSIVMNAAKQVTALWKEQYRVNVQSAGLPDNASAQIMVDDSIVTLNGTNPYTLWVDAYGPLSINVQSTQIQQSTTSYVYAGMRVDNQSVTGKLTITKPLNVIVTFTSVPKDSVNVQLAVSPTVAAPGYPLSITGSVQGSSTPLSSIRLLYSLNNADWQPLMEVSIAPDGSFSCTYPFAEPGNYLLKAFLPGDSNHSSTSQVVNVRIVESTIPIIGTSESLTRLVRTTMNALAEYPYLSSLLTVASGIMASGYVLTEYIIPGGSQLMGYIIGSFLLGFAFVFPVSAAVAVLRALTSHRRPSFLWLTPIAGLWSFSLGLLVASLLNSTMQTFGPAAETLLVSCNILMVPIATSLGIARLLA